MEDRSSRRMRTLVTRMAHGGLSAKKNAGALISMMARSTNRSNQRPDTLMQDRKPPDRRNLLRRTAGPYIGVKGGHAEQVAAAAGSPQKAALLAAGRHLRYGPIPAILATFKRPPELVA